MYKVVGDTTYLVRLSMYYSFKGENIVLSKKEANYNLSNLQPYMPRKDIW